MKVIPSALFALGCCISTTSFAHDLADLSDPDAQKSVFERAIPLVEKRQMSSTQRNAILSIVRNADLWRGTTVTVCFGSSDGAKLRQKVKDRIIGISRDWTGDGLIKFEFQDKVCSSQSAANIRIDIKDGAGQPKFESLVGVQSKIGSLKQGFYSMRLQFPEGSAYYDSDPVFSFYVLHEFGHALGVQHEHQRVNCEFDYKFIMQKFRYESVEAAKKQLAHILEFPQSAYSGGTYTSTQWDNMSVMKYNFSSREHPNSDDPRVFAKGKKSACYRDNWITSLSDFDREGIRKAYSQPLERDAILASLDSETVKLGSDAVRKLTGGAVIQAYDPNKSATDHWIALQESVDAVRADPASQEVLDLVLR